MKQQKYYMKVNQISEITIIVPVYNAEKHVRECLESIIAQTFTGWECVLVDDGSKDNSGSICDEYAQRDHRFRVIHKKNGGASSARNVGLNNINTPFFTCVDVDDRISPQFISKLLEYKDSDMAIGGCVVVSNGEKYYRKVDKVYTYLLPENADKLNVNVSDPRISCFYATWGKLFKTSIVRNMGIDYPENLRLGEDTVFNLRYVKNCRRITFFPDVIYKYFNDTNPEKYAMDYADFIRHHDAVFKVIEETEIKQNVRLSGLRKGMESAYFSSLLSKLKKLEYKDYVNFRLCEAQKPKISLSNLYVRNVVCSIKYICLLKANTKLGYYVLKHCF